MSFIWFIPAALYPYMPGQHWNTLAKINSSAVSIVVRKEIIELAEKMVKYKLAGRG